MRRGLLLVTLVSAAAWAQEEEFSLPPLGQPDAGLPEPSAPPLAPPSPLPEPPRPPPPPTWAKLGGSASAFFTALRDYSVGAEVTLVYALAGTPAHSPTVTGEVEGALLQAGLQAGYARAGGPLCGGSTLCATRISGGVAFKGGWARGLPSVRDGVARAQTMYFGELDVLLANFDIESAPLAPGINSWELLTRLRLGLHFTSEASRSTYTGVTLLLAAVVEAIPLSRVTQGVSIGACAGLGF